MGGRGTLSGLPGLGPGARGTGPALAPGAVRVRCSPPPHTPSLGERAVIWGGGVEALTQQSQGRGTLPENAAVHRQGGCSGKAGRGTARPYGWDHCTREPFRVGIGPGD